MNVKFGIFGKMFLYTLAFLVVTIGVTAFLFAGQFKAFYDYSQRTIVNNAFSPLIRQIEGKSAEEIQGIVEEFHQDNPQYEFYVTTPTGNFVYKMKLEKGNGDGDTIDATILIKPSHDMPDNIFITRDDSEPQSGRTNIAQYRLQTSSIGEQVTLTAVGIATDNSGYGDIIKKLIVGLIVLVILGIVGAALLAREMTSPIKRLAAETRKMSELLPAERPPLRHDELGQLEQDVHDMYDNLKITITELENEIAREKEMEENQRYFFSAASHELKTPVAAIAALLEGMLANVGEYSNHPKYLRECIKMTKGQNRIISEILEIVNLAGGKVKVNIVPVNLSDLAESILSEHRTLAENAGLVMEVDICAETVCLADANMLGRAVSNIVMNAVQNTPVGGAVRIWSEENEGVVKLSVLNTNAHIDEKAADKLFEPFYRADKARSRAHGRSGLGLSIVKNLLDGMRIPFALENKGNDVVFCMELIAA